MGILGFFKRSKFSKISEQEKAREQEIDTTINLNEIENNNDSKNMIINTDETNNDNEDQNIDIKALAYIYNMIYVAFSNNGKIDIDAMSIIFECSSDIFNIEDPNEYFNICYEQFQDEYIHKNSQVHKEYLNSLSADEIEELFYQLLRLILSDRKLMKFELNALGNIASMVNYPSEDFNNMIEETFKNLYIIERTENHYKFLTYYEIFNSALDKFNSKEYEDSLKLYDLFLSMISNDKLLFGKLIDEKIYIERNGDNYEAIPLENVYFNRSQCYIKLGEKNEALTDLLRAIDINSDDSSPLLYHHTGCLMFELGDHTKCLEYFDKAIELDEIESSESYYMRGVAYLSDKCEKQDKNKGLIDLKKYLEFNPKDVNARELLITLESI